MPNTTSNQRREIATKGTSHIPTNDEDDVGINPLNLAEAPFENKVRMNLLTPGTSRTFIQNQPIWTKPHQVGPTSYPSKAPYVVGKRSGTHIDEAKATDCSHDVFAESNGVVRTNDPTTQNHKNCKGYVDSGMFEGKSAAEIAFLKAHCTITELTGINEVSGTPPPGVSFGAAPKVARNLGYPGPRQAGVPPYYLEILSSSEVKFKATRKDITKPAPENPTCWREGVHTRWLATRTGENERLTLQEDGKDEFTVTPNMTDLYFGDDDTGHFKSLNERTFRKTETESHKSDADNIRGNKPGRQERRDAITNGDEKIGIKETSKVSAKGLMSIEAVFAFFLYHHNPVNVNVQATSCAGSRNAQLRIFPRQKVDVTVSFSDSVSVQAHTQRQGAGRRAMNAALKAIGKMREVGWYVEKIAELAKKKVKVTFLEETSVRFEMQYKCCTEEKKGFWGNNYTPAHVGLTWKLSLTAGVLLGFEIAISVSLLNLVAPCVGETAATALRRLGVKVDLVFEAKLKLPLTISIGQDEYDYWSNTGIEIGIRPELGLYLEVGTGIQLIRVGVSFPMSLTAFFGGGDKPNVILMLQPKGEIRTVVTLTVLKDTWFENTWTNDVSWLRVNWQGPKIDVWTRA